MVRGNVADPLARNVLHPTSRADLIKVGVGPAHARLDREMQAVEPDIERHLRRTAGRTS